MKPPIPSVGAQPPCNHALVVDEARDGAGELLDFEWVATKASHLDAPIYISRRCLLCGHAYDRQGYLTKLAEAIRARHRLPPSPWSAQERSDGAIW